MRRFLAPFASRDFRLLWSASTISLLGDGVWYVAISWQTLELSNSATALAVVWLAFTLPHIATLLSADEVVVGTSVHDSATLTGATSDAVGTVTYSYYTNNTCSENPVEVSTAQVSGGDVNDPMLDGQLD